MGLKIVDKISQMRPEDRARAAEWFRQRAHKLMAVEYAAEIMPQIDRLVEMAEELSHAEAQRSQR